MDHAQPHCYSAAMTQLLRMGIAGRACRMPADDAGPRQTGRKRAAVWRASPLLLLAAACLLLAVPALGMGGHADSATSATSAASGNTRAAAAPDAGGAATATQAVPPAPAAPATPAAPMPGGQFPPAAEESRNYAPGYDGFAGTWRDPATGDIITSVIAPRRPPAQEQQPPIYVAPQIDPGYGGGYPPGYGNGGGPAYGPWDRPGWRPDGRPDWQPGWQPGTPHGPSMPPAMRPDMPPDMRPGWRPDGTSGTSGTSGTPGDMGTQPPGPWSPGQNPGFAPPPPTPGTNPAPGQPPNPVPNPAPPPPFNPPPSPGPGPWGQPQNPGGLLPPQGMVVPPPGWPDWGFPGGTGNTGGVKAWTPGQPPVGGWRPKSWSPDSSFRRPASSGPVHAWRPLWQPFRQSSAQPFPQQPGLHPVLPPFISQHLGPPAPRPPFRGGI